ncbi:PREDICTED: uncharacterized protein LOC109461525 [Branchiostoma belcheri]|uniref:Uncharacterized protein LOC109461525 n=1 Tax=Branchiostoma belcheri TaxID=7741 RepID=A0A6P4XRY8_BRABE|nr:PREDICTED: uncharacterized protein LOC109461525 [Branchiostoma belcheri]
MQPLSDSTTMDEFQCVDRLVDDWHRLLIRTALVLNRLQHYAEALRERTESESASEDSASVVEVYVEPPASPELIDISGSPPPSPSSTRATTGSPPAYEYTPRSPSTSPPPRYNTGTTW